MRLARLATVPGMMVNRLDNDGKIVHTHALQNGSKGVFKDRVELGEDQDAGESRTNAAGGGKVLTTGFRARLAKNAEFARRDRRPELVNRGEKSVNSAHQQNDEIDRRDTSRPYQDNKVVHHGVQGKLATRLSRTVAWASEGQEELVDVISDMRSDRKSDTVVNVSRPDPLSTRTVRRTSSESPRHSHGNRKHVRLPQSQRQYKRGFRVGTVRRSAAIENDMTMGWVPRYKRGGGGRKHTHWGHTCWKRRVGRGHSLSAATSHGHAGTLRKAR